MADPTPLIELQLRRAVVTVRDANDQREKLRESFKVLTQDQAAALLTRILTWDGSRLPKDFRRPDRAIRLELLLLLVHRLGTQAATKFLIGLKGDGRQAPDPKLTQGLQMVFPAHAKAQRDRFLAALKADLKPLGMPSVLLKFRNEGKYSVDNDAYDIEYYGLRNHPLGPDPADGKNYMEIQGAVVGHRPDAEYRFDRTIEVKEWYRANGQWAFLKTKPLGSPDNKSATDEDHIPDNDHIYVMDAPGFATTPATLLSGFNPNDRKSVTDFVYMINAIETVDVKVGIGHWMRSAELSWFSITWFEKSGETWRRKADMNTIREGSIPGLTDAQEPPVTF